jgi:hypothetical protein
VTVSAPLAVSGAGLLFLLTVSLFCCEKETKAANKLKTNKTNLIFMPGLV